MNATKRFSLQTILTVTTGRLLTKPEGPSDNGIGDLYEILAWMTGDEPFTHALPRFANECKPWLYRWFPELKNAEAHLDDLDYAIKCVSSAKKDVYFAIENWISLCVADWGMKDEYDVPKIPMDDHDVKNPIQELEDMVGKGKVIVITQGDQ